MLFTVIMLGLFAFTAFYLYQKQKVRLNYLSFVLPEAQHSVIIPDIDRLVDKLEVSDELGFDSWPVDLKTGVDTVFQHNLFSFNRELSKDCFISFNSNEWVVVFNTTSSINSIVPVIATEFAVDLSYDSGKLKLGGQDYFADHFGNYLAVSNTAIDPMEMERELTYGNADYVVFADANSHGERHILSRDYHHIVREVSSFSAIGKPVDHQAYFEAAPTTFEELSFYGSSRFQEDQSNFFDEPSSESFDWVNAGIMYIRQGEHEIIIGQQGEERDLNLMLEEQTLEIKGDSAQLVAFNIGNFKVLSFETHFNWTSSIPNLESELHYYSEYKSFNILANSIPAIRWYIGQIQLGNLMGNNEGLLRMYQDCLPEKSHFAQIYMDSTAQTHCQSKIYQKDSLCLWSEVEAKQKSSGVNNVDLVYDFSVEIVPNRIQVYKEAERDVVLLNNLKEVAAYDTDGTKLWKLTLSTPLVEKPQIVDFENDGMFELVLFQSNQIDVVNNKGKSITGFPIKLPNPCSAGLAVNYDNSYKWRIIANVGNTVKVYSEAGKNVDGWMFGGMGTGIDSKIYHVLAQGKDIITFKDKNAVQHVLNRRGEHRLENIQFKLPNETDFVTGTMESALRKMGYAEGYIYNYYILDGTKDSVKIDQQVTPVRTFWEFNEGKPLLIIEEAQRLLIINEFGYVQSQVLKPNQSNEFVGLVGKQDYGFVFADNSQNTIYLLNNYGKMVLPQAVKGSAVSIIHNDLLYTFSGINIKAYQTTE